MQQFLILFEQQKYTECIFALSQYNLQNNPVADTYLLLAKCNYQLGLVNQEVLFYQQSFKDLSKALLLNNQLLEARLYRAYLAIYCLNDGLQTAFEDSAFIIQNANDESKTKGLQYQFDAAYAVGNNELAIESLQQTKPLIKIFYKDNQPQRLQELSLLEMRMGDVFLNLKNDEEHALSFYEKGFNYYSFNTPFNHFFINILIKHKKYEAAARVAGSILDALAMDGGHEQIPVIIKQFGNWLSQGLVHRGIAKMYIRAMRNSSETDQLDILSKAKELQKIYPDEYYFPHSIGSILYDFGNYKEALPYLEKAISLEYSSLLLVYLIQAHYKVHKQLVKLPKPPINNDPIEAYSAGININFFTGMFEEESDKWRAAKGCEVYFYANAHEEFGRFFYSNTGTPMANNVHYFAMNCTNYGVALTSVGRFTEAIPIHKTGYALSPFWEQINSLANAEYKAEKYVDCLSTIQTIYNEYSNVISMYYHINYQVMLVRCNLHTKQPQQALTIINNLELQEAEIFEALNGLNVAEARFIKESYNNILNEKAILLQQTEGIENALESLQKRLESDPDNAIVYYMLLQQYHIGEQYKNAVDCTENYFQLVNIEKESPEVLQNIYYRNGASLRHLKRYEESIENLQKAVKLNAIHYWSRHELGLAFFESGNMIQFKIYGHWCINQYLQNDFNWDQKIAEVAFALIEVYRAEKNKKEIQKLADFILKKDSKNINATLIKKEFSRWF